MTIIYKIICIWGTSVTVSQCFGALTHLKRFSEHWHFHYLSRSRCSAIQQHVFTVAILGVKKVSSPPLPVICNHRSNREPIFSQVNGRLEYLQQRKLGRGEGGVGGKRYGFYIK